MASLWRDDTSAAKRESSAVTSMTGYCLMNDVISRESASPTSRVTYLAISYMQMAETINGVAGASALANFLALGPSIAISIQPELSRQMGFMAVGGPVSPVRKGYWLFL